ncbi:hypothetical protein BHE74_00039981 [Ensete ventricosum]|nr:hypothetical protein GW17_00032804 [Ensete ventricosum]RWW53527.1 hypothetical protein BHE74_00039981 [Ensete ventricosum]RZR89122.1 hypothetical protein BHM03_00016792 [Ensete ventricosum]
MDKSADGNHARYPTTLKGRQSFLISIALFTGNRGYHRKDNGRRHSCRRSVCVTWRRRIGPRPILHRPEGDQKRLLRFRRHVRTFRRCMRRPAAATPAEAPLLRLQRRMRSRVRRVPGELGGGRCLQVAAGMHAYFPCPMRGLLAAAEAHLPDLPNVGGPRRGSGRGRGRRHEEFESQVRSPRSVTSDSKFMFGAL